MHVRIVSYGPHYAEQYPVPLRRQNMLSHILPLKAPPHPRSALFQAALGASQK